jgi:hypothetical protein
MNIVRYSTDKILNLLHDQQVATMPQLKAALGTRVEVTVFRKLATLPYRSSYSHCGAYYTLDSIARYDELGLWSYQDIHFSRYGTLLNTAAALVGQAPAGYLADELAALVHVAVKDPLRQLVQAGRLSRREWAGRYLYGAAERARWQEQWAARRALQDPGEDLQKAKVLFYSLLDEQQRRLYAGLESVQCGHGGEQRMAEVFGLNVDTVARGRHELLSGQVLRERVRRSGGGRPTVDKKRPKS